MISIHCVSMALNFLSPISMSDPDLQCVVASDDEMHWFRVISSFAEAAGQEPADWAALRPDLAWRLVVKNQGAKLHGRDWRSMKAHSAGFELDAGCTASSASPDHCNIVRASATECRDTSPFATVSHFAAHEGAGWTTKFWVDLGRARSKSSTSLASSTPTASSPCYPQRPTP